MASIKKKQQTPKTDAHALTAAEFNYIMNINEAKQNIVAEYNRVMSAFLSYVSCTRLGYDNDKEFQFELDFGSKEHVLKVSVLDKNN